MDRGSPALPKTMKGWPKVLFALEMILPASYYLWRTDIYRTGGNTMHRLPACVRIEIAMFLASQMLACARIRRKCRRVIKRLTGY
jgi:hypothetical protein